MKQGKTLMYIVAGNLLLAFAVCAFVVPNHFMAGGSTGVALALHSWIPLPLSAITAVVNTSLFVLGFVCLGKKFAAASLCSTVIYPMVMGVMEKLPLGQWFGGNLMLSAVLAGVFMGGGIGLVLRAGGSTGGMDIPPCILQKVKHIPVGVSMVCFDLVILAAQMLRGSWEGIFYGMTIIVLTSAMVSLYSRTCLLAQ